MTERRFTYSRLYVPTRTDAEGVRHIIAYRDGPTLCKQEAIGEQVAPQDRNRTHLCTRCTQKCIRQLQDV